jgi:chloramphenicol 3-O-phosphotransferase
MTSCIILNGPSSAGKTSIIKEIQLIEPEKARIRIDDIADLYFGMFSSEYNHTKEWGRNDISVKLLLGKCS